MNSELLKTAQVDMTKLRELHHRIGAALGLDRTCLNCAHWSQGVDNGGPSNPVELCHRYNQRPPARIIVSGCPEHMHDIPF